jgi:hypothetical protein
MGTLEFDISDSTFSPKFICKANPYFSGRGSAGISETAYEYRLPAFFKWPHFNPRKDYLGPLQGFTCKPELPSNESSLYKIHNQYENRREYSASRDNKITLLEASHAVPPIGYQSSYCFHLIPLMIGLLGLAVSSIVIFIGLSLLCFSHNHAAIGFMLLIAGIAIAACSFNFVIRCVFDVSPLYASSPDGADESSSDIPRTHVLMLKM